jgi:hypothetical protein
MPGDRRAEPVDQQVLGTAHDRRRDIAEAQACGKTREGFGG